MNLREVSKHEHEIDYVAKMKLEFLLGEQNKDEMINLSHIKHRLQYLLEHKWNIFIIELRDDIIGYLLYRIEYNEENLAKYYINQYFIRKEYRNRGYGAKGFQMFIDAAGEDSIGIELDAVVKQLRAEPFWIKLGFQAINERYMYI